VRFWGRAPLSMQPSAPPVLPLPFAPFPDLVLLAVQVGVYRPSNALARPAARGLVDTLQARKLFFGQKYRPSFLGRAITDGTLIAALIHVTR
jgi:hypothetical protein